MIAVILWLSYLLYISYGLYVGENIRFVEREKNVDHLPLFAHFLLCHLWPYFVWRGRR